MEYFSLSSMIRHSRQMKNDTDIDDVVECRNDIQKTDGCIAGQKFKSNIEKETAPRVEYISDAPVDKEIESDEDSVYQPSENDDLTPESMKIVHYPISRKVAGIQKGVKVEKASRLHGFPLDECWIVPGFKDYVNHLANFQTDLEIKQNNNVTAVRTFLGMFDHMKTKMSMALLADRDNIMRYMDLIKAQSDYAPKTRLQKIESLKKALRWLRLCTFSYDCEYAPSFCRATLEAIIEILSDQCRQLRPYAKADEGRASLLENNILRNTFLDIRRFEALGRTILAELEAKHLDLVSYSKRASNDNAIKNTAFDFERLLVTGLFVLLPTQRAKIITEVDLADITFNKEGASIKITMEKTSYRRLGIRDAVGRHIYVPMSVAQYLQLWVRRYRRCIAKPDSAYTLWLDRVGKSPVSNAVSRWVCKECSRISGANLTPLSIRRLRATYFVNSINNNSNLNIQSDAVARYAAEVGQSVDIVYKYYVLKNPVDQIEASRCIADQSNEFIFGSKQILASDKLNAYCEKKSTVSVLIEKKQNMKYEKDLESLKKLWPMDESESYIESTNGTRTQTTALATNNERSIVAYFKAEKIFDQAKAKNVIVDLTEDVCAEEHDHNMCPSIVGLKYSHSEDSRRRIIDGKWLTDIEVNGALSILRNQHPTIGGFENTIVLSNSIPREMAIYCINIYIVHDSGNHWVCARYTCKRRIFEIYDSLQKLCVSRAVMEQLKKVGGPQSRFAVMNMQRQIGGDDCGLFAIAIAADLAHGNDPSMIRYDQHAMRSHLVSCFDHLHLSIFPRL